MKKESLILLFLLFIGCKNEQTLVYEEGLPVQVIDFTSFKRKSLNDLPSGLWGEKQYILLQADDDEMLFGNPRKIVIRNNQLYIYDTQNRVQRLLVYDMQGNTVAKVGIKGSGPSEYISIADFDVDDNGYIYCIDGVSLKLRIYDPFFQHIEAVNLPFAAEIVKTLPGSPDLFWGLGSFNEHNDKGRKIVRTDKAIQTKEAWGNYDEFTDNLCYEAYDFVESAGKIFYNRSKENYLYTFSSDGVLESVHWVDFGKENLPDIYRQDYETYPLEYLNYTYLLNFMVVSDNYLLGKLYDKGANCIFYVDRKTNTFYQSDNLGTDHNVHLTSFQDGKIISVLDPDHYSLMEKEALLSLPNHVQKHLQSDNYVICIQEVR